jgi:hypothetical protein
MLNKRLYKLLWQDPVFFYKQIISPPPKICIFKPDLNVMRNKNDVTIGQALELMVDRLKLRNKLNESRIRENWAKVMGKPIARYTQQVSLKEGKLYIKIDSAPLKQELNYSRAKIIELFNKELGADVVTDVVVY